MIKIEMRDMKPEGKKEDAHVNKKDKVTKCFWFISYIPFYPDLEKGKKQTSHISKPYMWVPTSFVRIVSGIGSHFKVSGLIFKCGKNSIGR